MCSDIIKLGKKRVADAFDPLCTNLGEMFWQEDTRGTWWLEGNFYLGTISACVYPDGRLCIIAYNKRDGSLSMLFNGCTDGKTYWHVPLEEKSNDEVHE